MAKNKSGGGVGGFVFNVFNVGFTVFMFILPTIGLAYWYLYIRDPGGAAAPRREVVVQQVPKTPTRALTGEPQPPPEKTPAPITSGFFDEPLGSAAQQPEPALVRETKTAPAARQEYETRSWTDRSGEFSVQARFYSVTGDQVKIITAEDRQIVVPIAKLSDADQGYLRSIFRNKGIQPSF